jgi:hypothetical protein
MAHRHVWRRELWWLISLLGVLACAIPGSAGPDDLAAAKAGVTAPAQWWPAPASPLRVHIVRGLWTDHYGVERALARLGGDVVISESWHILKAGWGWCTPGPYQGTLDSYLAGYGELQRQHLVIIANVNGNAFSPVQRKMLKDFVERGGAVLWLGGKFAFGAQYQNTAFEEMAPVTFAGETDLAALPQGGLLALAPGGRDEITPKLSWAQQPRLFWHHTVVPKAGATVRLTVDAHPLLVTGTHGAGRVGVFAGSVMGDPAAGQVPFWEWDGWPSLLAGTIHWLTEPRSQQSLSTAALRAQLKDEITAADGKAGIEHGILAKYALRCTDVAIARDLLTVAADGEADLSPELGDMLFIRTRRFIEQSCAPVANALLQTGRTNQMVLGLRLLGRSRAEGARAILEAVLQTGAVDTEEQDEELEAGPGADAEDPQARMTRLRLGALDGLGALGSPEALPALRAAIRQYQPLRAKLALLPTNMSVTDELFQASVYAAVRCGAPEQAAAVVEEYLETGYIAIRNRGILDAPDYGLPMLVAMKKSAAAALPRARLRQQVLLESLTPLPASVLPVLATCVAAEEDPRVIPLAFAIFGQTGPGGSAANTVVWEALQAGKVPGVRDLATYRRQAR